MERKQKLLLAKSALIAGVIPILVYAYEFGPDPGYCGVPGENGTCVQSGCHVGTVNSGQGSVSVAFPNGQAYAPGVKQHLIVTVADPAATQQAWGFQLTARSSTNTQAQAGAFAPTDTTTQVLCAPLSLSGIVPAGAQGCPTSAPLAYVEHTLAGVQKTLGQKGSATFEFDWTPPASSTGNITVYLAGNAGLPVQPFTPNGAHIYTKTYTLTPSAAPPPMPAIDPTLGVQNQTTGPNTPGQPVSPGSLVAIYGTNFSAANALATTIPLPATLANVSVTIGGIAAPMVGIAHGLTIGGKTVDQINAIVPWKVTAGMASVVVTSSNIASSSVTVPIAATDPGIFYIATDSGGVNRPLVYNNSDNTFAYPSGIFGTNLPNTRPASIVNDVLVIWSTGLGPVTVTPPDGAPATDSKGNFVESDTTSKPTVLVGGRQANVLFSGLTQYPSIYQINIKLDPGTPTGNAIPIQIQSGDGTPTTDQLKIAVTN
jgi:uncharacterized protein (TIGR03437 family)